jgi:hypothetical protein
MSKPAFKARRIIASVLLRVAIDRIGVENCNHFGHRFCFLAWMQIGNRPKGYLRAARYEKGVPLTRPSAPIREVGPICRARPLLLLHLLRSFRPAPPTHRLSASSLFPPAVRTIKMFMRPSSRLRAFPRLSPHFAPLPL